MSRFYALPGNVDKKSKKILIEGEEAHHIIDVMRMREKEAVVVFDGTGAEYAGTISSIDGKEKVVKIDIARTVNSTPEKLPEIHLAQALPKKDKMDYIVEKATELGVSRVIPVISQRTVVRPDPGSMDKKISRWDKIARASAKQCGRASVPDISKARDFREIVRTFAEYDLVLLACLSEETLPLKKVLREKAFGKILILIGPEGDFTPEEIKSASSANCRKVSLGKRVLKSDTAGLFVLSVLGYEAG